MVDTAVPLDEPDRYKGNLLLGVLVSPQLDAGEGRRRPLSQRWRRASAPLLKRVKVAQRSGRRRSSNSSSSSNTECRSNQSDRAQMPARTARSHLLEQRGAVDR